VHPKEIRSFVAQNGIDYFSRWFDSIRDKRTSTIIDARINRLLIGNKGNTRFLEAGLWELKIDFGPGFRVYYGEDDETVIILLAGGDKSTQQEDISRAKKLWEEYRGQSNE
jgi:putative addiction module killer protein